MKTKAGGSVRRLITLSCMAVVACGLLGAQETLAKSKGNSGNPGNSGNSNKKDDKCKDHDRCKEHDKCRDHDKGHDKCKPRIDKCKDHDRCKEHDKCRDHDKGHDKCQPRIDKCKDHDRCKEHDKCRDHDKGHDKCKPRIDKCKDHDRCKEHDKCRDHDKGHDKCKPRIDKCKDHDRCREHDKCRDHDKGHGNCRPKVDKCRDRCIPHDKCRRHDSGHENCQPPLEVESYSGRAIVTHLTNLLHGPPSILIGDTGPLPYDGGLVQAEVDGTNVQDFLLIDEALAMSSGVSNSALSEVAIGGFTLRIMATNGTLHTVSFDSMHVRASAECNSNGPAVGASVQINGLKIDDQVIAITGEPNQRIDYNGGFVMINLQSSRVEGHYGEVTVAGLYIHNDGCMEGPIGLAHADIDCHTESDECECSDRVTGGGFIFGTPSGEKANFGVGGGMQNGRLWGHLNYVDHGDKIHVKATAVTSYSVVDGTTRQMTYDVTVNGQAATATVIVSDLGEPGRDDTFAITLSTGYSAGGDLAGDRPGGGNIQLHKTKCR